jgi:hypothetical protein
MTVTFWLVWFAVNAGWIVELARGIRWGQRSDEALYLTPRLSSIFHAESMKHLHLALRWVAATVVVSAAGWVL